MKNICLWQVAIYLRKIFDFGILVDDIGIISPYRKQTSKLREILTSLELPLPKIGSVEEFQGQEKPVIIVTTVRTLAEATTYVEADIIRGLGFLRSPKRFNVAVTRAMSLLVVVGDPHLLGADSIWNYFIKHCIQLGSYVGTDLPEWLKSY